MNSRNNQLNIPQARIAMDHFKTQAAQESGINLANGCTVHLISRKAGSVRGQAVTNRSPKRTNCSLCNMWSVNGYLVKMHHITIVSAS